MTLEVARASAHWHGLVAPSSLLLVASPPWTDYHEGGQGLCLPDWKSVTFAYITIYYCLFLATLSLSPFPSLFFPVLSGCQHVPCFWATFLWHPAKTVLFMYYDNVKCEGLEPQVLYITLFTVNFFSIEINLTMASKPITINQVYHILNIWQQLMLAIICTCKTFIVINKYILMAFYLLLYLQSSCTNRINNVHIIYILCSSSAECHNHCMPQCTQEGTMFVCVYFGNW